MQAIMRPLGNFGSEGSGPQLVYMLYDLRYGGLVYQRRKMVTQSFGDLLFDPGSECLKEFPSPESLKRRIIISTKPSKEYLQAKGESSYQQSLSLSEPQLEKAALTYATDIVRCESLLKNSYMPRCKIWIHLKYDWVLAEVANESTKHLICCLFWLITIFNVIFFCYVLCSNVFWIPAGFNHGLFPELIAVDCLYMKTFIMKYYIKFDMNVKLMSSCYRFICTMLS